MKASDDDQSDDDWDEYSPEDGAADSADGESDEPLYDGPSKSQIKREHLALQALAEELTRLPRAEIEGLGLGEGTLSALAETARIKDHRALGRHYKRIANCLARDNLEPLHDLLATRNARAQAATARHHQVEQWRARLIESGDAALTEFFDAYPEADRQALRQLVRDARRDAGRGRPEAPRRLFRHLRELLDAAEDDPDEADQQIGD